MDDRDAKTPPTDEQADLSKAQSEQQPFDGQTKQPPTSQDDDGNAGQSDTTTKQRSDIEGGTSTGQATDIEGSSAFVGAEGTTDTSSELIEDESDFDKDRRGDGE